MFYASAFWKRQARDALKGHWLTGLLIALIVNLPSLLVQGIAAATGNDLAARLSETLYGAIAAGGTAVDAAALAAGLKALQESAGIWIMQGLNLAAWLMTPCLTIGMVHWLLTRLRKREAGDVTAVFSRMGTFFKGIGLRLYVVFRVFLWMLPGLGVSVATTLPLWLSDRSSAVSVLSAVNTVQSLQPLAVGVTVALGVMAMMKYALGDMVLADHPEMGPIRAAKESKALTKGRTGQLFGLYLSFLPWYLAEMLLANLTLALFGSVSALMVQMLCALALDVYQHAAVSAFYLEALPAGTEPAGEADAEDQLG